MQAAGNQAFRITYEAFSKFSNSLNRCRTFDDVAACFKVNLKYLFNYFVFRASYTRNEVHIHMTVIPGEATIQTDAKPHYFSYENILLDKGIPHVWTDMSSFNLPAIYDVPAEDEGKLWGWNIKNENDREIVVSLLSGNSKPFTATDIPFLRLVADNLESKLFELCLIGELDEKNGIITNIVEHQHKVIQMRTNEIAEKNKRLLEISILNAHNVREPLSRIMGLIPLLEDDNEDIKEIIPLLKCSSVDLDQALRNVIDMATDDIIKLKASDA